MEFSLDIIDKYILSILLLLNIVLWNKKTNACLTCLVVFVFLGFIFPLMSSGREVDRNIAINGPAMDNFELLYTFSVFPVYWVALAFQLFLFLVKYDPGQLENLNE